MKISGPKGPPPAPPPTQAPEADPGAKGAEFKQVLGPAAPSQAEPSQVAPGPTSVNTTDELVATVSAQLQQAQLDGAQAVEQLIEGIVRQRVSQAAPQLRERLQQALRQALEDDPHLAQQLRNLQADR